MVDLLEERADVAIRAGPLRDSSLIARKLWQSRMVVVGAPAYLREHGMPKTPADLAGHNCLDFCFTRMVEGWPFLDSDGRAVTVAPQGNALVSDGEAMRLLALSGLGLARLSRFQIGRDIEAGTLVPVLEDFNPGDDGTAARHLCRPGRTCARPRARVPRFPGRECAACQADQCPVETLSPQTC